jgi:hypothetical protein
MKRKIYIHVLAIILACSILSLSLVAYSMTTSEEKLQKTATEVSKPLPQTEREMSQNNNSTAVKREPRQNIDLSSINISKAIESSIKVLDATNAEKNISNCKRMISELNVSEQYQDEIGKQIKIAKNTPDVLIAYDFLSENYGTVNELKGVLKEKVAGKTFAGIFKEYKETHKEFVPGNFKPGYLEELLKTPGISADDIMIADRISQKGLKTFEELIELKKQGKTWREINTGLGIINTSEKIPHISMTSSQVKSQIERSGLTEKQVIEALSMAGRLDQEDTEIVDKVKAGKSKENIFAEAYEKKYR